MDEMPIGRLIYGLAKIMAVLGGVVLAAISAVTVISVIGRALIPFGLSAVPGDVEIVQAGILFSVLAFMPWCHLERGHAIVAILTDRFPVRFNALAEALWDVVMLLAAVFITWRFWAGLLDKFGNGESTFILRVPIWISYACGMVGAAVFVAVAAYCAIRSVLNAISSDPRRPVSESGE